MYVNLHGVSAERPHTLKYPWVHFGRNLCFKEQVNLIIIKASKCLAVMRMMGAANCEQHLIFLLHLRLVLSLIEYALAVLILNMMQVSRF